MKLSLFAFIQAKLTLGNPNNQYEQVADSIVNAGQFCTNCSITTN
jgi:hypothetical protein